MTVRDSVIIMIKIFIVSAFTLSGFLTVTSCGIKDVGTRTVPTKFLKSTGVDTTVRVERLPFEHSWRDANVDISKYKHIVIRPVTTAYLRTDLWEESKSAAIPNKRAYVKRCNALARYWTKSLNKSFSSPVCSFYKTNSTSEPGTLILEIALTEVRFNSLATKSGSPPPLPSAVSALTGAPLCAYEARSRDAASGKLFSTSADRRGPQIKVIPTELESALAKPNEEICDEWSEQLMQRTNFDLFPVIRRKWLSLF